MYISTLATILLLGSAVLTSPIPDPESKCLISSSILQSCKDFALAEDNLVKHTLTASCQDCSGAWNPTSLDLDQVLGNIRGVFTWGEKDFSKSADLTTVDGKTSILTADLETGVYLHDEDEDKDYMEKVKAVINLSEKIQNEGGSLKFVPAGPPPM